MSLVMKKIKKENPIPDSHLAKKTAKQNVGKNKSRQNIYTVHKEPMYMAKESTYKYALGKSMETDKFSLIKISRQGVSYEDFIKVVEFSGFTIKEWAGYIQLNERTLQRYKAENKLFEQIYSERILGIARLLQRGVTVFDNMAALGKWLNAENVALGKTTPKQLLDSTFGINILEDELIRIEHGIFA